MSALPTGSSLRGTWTRGGIIISMSNSGRYMVRGGREASLALGSRTCRSSNMYQDEREVVVVSEKWSEVAGMENEREA